MKPLVNSWDVFDTLLTRFVLDPIYVFELIGRGHPEIDFRKRRLGAQAALDKIGKPYVIHDIYKVMIEGGIAHETAKRLLIEELATERAIMLPIRSAVQRVAPGDLLISDMYLPPEIISSMLGEICDLHAALPVIRSNWGKHTGTIWPKILQQYVIRIHYGDNPSSDDSVPRKFGIQTVLLRDHDLTPWEKSLAKLGLIQLTAIQRETRLRSLDFDYGLFESLAAGPYLSLLYGYAVYLALEFGEDAVFGFLSRDCDDLARIFRSIYPGSRSFNIDLSRRLIRDGELDPVFRNELPAKCILVDGVSTGRSVTALLERVGAQDRVFSTLLFLDHLLTAQQAVNFAGRFVHKSSEYGGSHYPLEWLMQSPYPPVTLVLADAESGGLVRSFGRPELSTAEARMIHAKSEIVTHFIRTVRQRGLPALTKLQSQALIKASLARILQPAAAEETLPGSLFPSFVAREKFAPF